MAAKINIIQKLIRQFQPIGAQWKRLRQKTGEFLIDAAGICNRQQFEALKRHLKDHYNIAMVEQEACMGIADGLIPPELLQYLPASMVTSFTVQTMPDPKKIYPIYSPTSGAVVNKRLKDMDRHEIKANVLMRQGVVNVIDARDAISRRELPVMPALAKSVRYENGYLVFYVPSLKRDIRHPLDSKFVKSVNKWAVHERIAS